MVSADWIIRVVLFAIVHWVLAGFMINDLASRKKIFGGRKAPWAVVILCIPCFGSIFYIMFHPRIFSPGDDGRDD